MARRWAVAAGSGAVIAGTLIQLDRAWYSQYDRGGFRFFDDGAEWQEMDKVGHGFSTYTVGVWGTALMRWCRFPEKTSVWVGGSVGLAYLTAVEVLDGTSKAWGFSGWDMAANVAGTGLFIGQELGWKEQRIRVKYSAHLTAYAPQRPDLLGEGLAERILKDYNGCTYWLSVNPNSFGWKGFPRWLNVATGYGAEGMLGARDPGAWQQFYFAPDIDLTRIRTRSRFLRTVFLVIDCVKVPLPALEFNVGGKVRAHALYF